MLAGCALEQDESAEPVESASEELASDIAVYTNTSPASPWQNWSWSTTVAFANTDAPLASGSTSQIKATMQAANGGLSLAHTGSELTTSDFDSITFDVRAPSASNVYLGVETLGGVSGGTKANIAVTTTWTRQTIKLDAIKGSLSTFGKMNWTASQSGQTFYVDNIKVVAKTAVSTTFPTVPLSVQKNTVVTLNSGASPYYLYVPNAYDATHRTPTKLLVWMHGCGGNGYGDAWAVSPGGTQSYLAISIGGRDGACWNVSTDSKLVLTALDDVRRRLNIDPRRVVIGGYSSGGDIAYRTMFYNAKRFAGILAENTSPFRDTGSSQSASLSAAAWKFNVVHLAHLSDTVYPITGVRTETDALRSAGYPETRIERAGTHYDADTSSSGTDYDRRAYLLPYMNAGWVAPL